MFNKPKHDHRGTGVASGLKYRENHALGGRVGFAHGGAHPTFSEKIAEFNRQQIEQMQQMEVPQFDPIQVKTGLPSIDIPGLVGPDVTFPMAGFMPTMGANTAMAASSPENQPTTLDLMTPSAQTRPKGMTEAEARAFTSAMGPKDDTKDDGLDSDRDPKLGAENQEKRLSNMLDRLDSVDNRAKLKRESLNEELAALRSKQDKDTRTMAALNILSAINDPTLPAGINRTAAGVQQLTAEAQNFAAIKKERDDIDLARKFDIADREIEREQALEDFRAQKEIEAEYGTEGVLVQNIRFFMKELGINPGTPEARSLIESFISDNKKGSLDTLTNNVFEVANLETTFPDQFRVKYGLEPKDKLEDGSESPLTFDEIKQAIANIQQQILDSGFKDGGRVGYAVGGQVTSNTNKNSAPIVMGYDQLKETLGEIVPDNVIKLIASNPTAFKEFAAIETNQDVSDFNDKYEVRFTLPEPAVVREQQGNFATPITSAVTAPSAVAASPAIMPMQTGAGQLTPTETAFLSPTEQAIKMRS